MEYNENGYGDNIDKDEEKIYNERTDYARYRYYKAEEDIYSDFRIKNLDNIETLGVSDSNKAIPMVGKYNKEKKVGRDKRNGYRLTENIPDGNINKEIDKLNIAKTNDACRAERINTKINALGYDCRIKKDDGDTDGYEDYIYKNIDFEEYEESYKVIDDERGSVKKKYDYLNESEKNAADKKKFRKQAINNKKDEELNKKNDININSRKKKTKSKKGKPSSRHSGGGIIIGFIIIAVFIITFFLCNFYLPNSWYDSMMSGEITLYAVGKYAVNNEDYKNIKDLYMAKGAAGYGYAKDDKIFVIADIYDSKEDAESVINNENNKGAFNSIIELKIREYCFDKVESNLVMTTTSALNYINICFYKLRGIAVSLSQKEMDSVEAKSRIGKLANELKNIKQFYDDNTYGSANDKVIKLKSQIGVCYKYLLDLTEQNNLPHAIRNTYTTIIILHIEIIEDSYN